MKIQVNGDIYEGTAEQIAVGMCDGGWGPDDMTPKNCLDHLHGRYKRLLGKSLTFSGNVEEDAKALFDAWVEAGMMEYVE